MITIDKINELCTSYDRENANLTTSNTTSEKEIVSHILKQYAMEVLPKNVSKAHINKDIHIHDLDFFRTRANCLNNPYEMIFMYGLESITCSSRPAKHFQVAINQILKGLSLSQSHLAGGQGFPLFNVLLAPFASGLSYEEIKQGIQHFIYEANQINASRGYQVPFSNINCEYHIPKFLENETIKYSCNKGNLFGDYEDESRQILRALCDIFNEKDANGKPFLFPNFITVVRNDLDKDDELLQKVIETNLITGNGYFINMLKYGKKLATAMGCVDGKEVVIYKYKEKVYVESFERMWNKFEEFGTMKHGISEYIEVPELLIFDSKNGFVKVKRIIRNPDKGDWIKIVLKNGKKLIATADHPLPTKDCGVKHVCDLSLNDILICVDYEDICNEIESNLEYVCINKIEFIGFRGEYSYDVETETGYFDVSGIYSHNCRTYLDDTFTGDYKRDVFGTGNLEYVTINLPRIALKNITENVDIYDRLQEMIDLSIQALLYRRYYTWKNWDNDLYPFFKKYYDEDYGYYYNIGNTTMSIGFVGLYEFKKLLGMSETEGLEFIKEFRKMIDELNDYTYKELALKYNIKYNEHEEKSRWSLIASPAESTAYTTKIADNDLYEEILKEHELYDKSYYTNSFHLPEYQQSTCIEKIMYEEKYHKYCNAGSITHLWNPEVDSDISAISKFVLNTCNKTNIRYFTFSPTLLYCKACKTTFPISSNNVRCPRCGNTEGNEFYSKITGYLQNTSNWNKGKLEEWKNRRKEKL